LENSLLQFLSDNGAVYVSKETQKVEALLGIPIAGCQYVVPSSMA